MHNIHPLFTKGRTAKWHYFLLLQKEYTKKRFSILQSKVENLKLFVLNFSSFIQMQGMNWSGI